MVNASIRTLSSAAFRTQLNREPVETLRIPRIIPICHRNEPDRCEDDRRSATEMNRTDVKTIDDLPELPFEKVLSYLSLGDVLKSRAVSRGWYHRINCFKVKSICCSERPSCNIRVRNRLLSDAFAQNFISSLQPDSFLAKFAPTILSDLKHLRFCDFNLDPNDVPAFVSTLKSFARLHQLDIILTSLFHSQAHFALPKIDLELNLPMLRGVHLERV